MDRIKVKDMQEGVIYALPFKGLYFKKEQGITRKTRVYGLLNGLGFNIAEEIKEEDKELMVEPARSQVSVYSDGAVIYQGQETISLTLQELEDIVEQYREMTTIPF